MSHYTLIHFPLDIKVAMTLDMSEKYYLLLKSMLTLIVKKTRDLCW